jgi:hypothetical protein
VLLPPWRPVAEALDVAVAVGVRLGAVDRDALADGLDEADGDGLALSDGVGDADVGCADVEPLVDGVTDATLFDTVGTPARTSWGAASSRDGVLYENRPLAKPAATATTTTAPATARSTARRWRRGGSASVGGSGMSPSPANRLRSVAMGAVSEGPRRVGRTDVSS